MGLSSSQARLMSLTSRLSDLELRAQRIQNDKIRLSDMGEYASEEYSKALNKEVLQIYSGVNSDGSSIYREANMDNLTTFEGRVQETDKQRFVKDGAGNILVSDKVGAAYSTSNGNLESFLNNLGYSQISPAERFANLKDSSTSALASDISSTLSTIGFNDRTDIIHSEKWTKVTELDSGVKVQLDSISAPLSSANAALPVLANSVIEASNAETTQANKVNSALKTVYAKLNDEYMSSKDATQKANLSTEVAKAQNAFNAFTTGDTSSIVNNLSSINTSVLSSSAASLYANKNSYAQASNGAVIVTQNIAKCLDSNNGVNDLRLNGGLQPLNTFITYNLVNFGLISKADANNPASDNYKYYANIYNLAASKGYQIADSSGTFITGGTKSIEYSNLPPTTNENNASWLQSQINSGSATVYKLNPNTNNYESYNPAAASNDLANDISTGINEANALDKLKKDNASKISGQSGPISTNIDSVYGILNALYNNSTFSAEQKAAVATQRDYASNAKTFFDAGNYDSAISSLGAININPLYTTLQITRDVKEDIYTPVTTRVYSSTLTAPQMAGNLSKITGDLASIGGFFTSNALKQNLDSIQGSVSSLIPGLGGSDTVSSASALSIQQTLSAISVDQVKSLIDGSSLTRTFINDPSAVSYYTNLFNEIKESRNTIPLSDNVMKNSDWLTKQIEDGNIFLFEYNKTGGSNGTGDFVNVSWNSGDTSLQMISDKEDMARAEADYEVTMSQIQAKDKRFDLQLTEINTEHKAIETEVDSVKKVIDKNIDRTFKTFNA